MLTCDVIAADPYFSLLVIRARDAEPRRDFFLALRLAMLAVVITRLVLFCDSRIFDPWFGRDDGFQR